MNRLSQSRVCAFWWSILRPVSLRCISEWMSGRFISVDLPGLESIHLDYNAFKGNSRLYYRKSSPEEELSQGVLIMESGMYWDVSLIDLDSLRYMGTDADYFGSYDGNFLYYNRVILRGW